MRKLIVSVIVSASAFIAIPTASAADANFGSCISNNTELASAQAPGQTGNGPLTIVDGQLILPHAYDGAQGCFK